MNCSLPEAGKGYEGAGWNLGQPIALEVEALQPRHIVENPVGEAGNQVVREVKGGEAGHVVEAGVGELSEEVAGEVEAAEVVQVAHGASGHRTEDRTQYRELFFNCVFFTGIVIVHCHSM